MTHSSGVEGERDDARRHSEALRGLLGRLLDEVEALAPERSRPGPRCDWPEQTFGAFEQIFGANQQVPDTGASYKEA